MTRIEKISQRLVRNIEGRERNERVRQLFAESGATDFEPHDRRAHHLRRQSALLHYAMTLEVTGRTITRWTPEPA